MNGAAFHKMIFAGGYRQGFPCQPSHPLPLFRFRKFRQSVVPRVETRQAAIPAHHDLERGGVKKSAQAGE